jgi:hypothetical protein
MVFEMLFNNKIQIIFFGTKLNFLKNELCTLLKEIYGKFQFFHLNKLSIKYEWSNLMFCVMFKWSMVQIE